MIEQWRIRKSIESVEKTTSTTGFSGFVALPVSIAVYLERTTASMALLAAPEILQPDFDGYGPRRKRISQKVSATAPEQLGGFWTPLL